MRTIRQCKSKLLLTVAYVGVLLGLWYFKLPCIFLSLLHVPCPGCGMSRAVFSVLRLDFASAFFYHPMFWSMPLLYLYFLYDGRLFPGKNTDRIILWSIAVGFLVQWFVKLSKYVIFC